MKGRKGYDGWEPLHPVRSDRNNAMRSCTVLDVGSVRMRLRYRTPNRGRSGGNTWEPVATPDQVILHPVDLDSLSVKRTGFDLRGLADRLGYCPTISPRDAYDYILVAAYNAYQRSRHDPRRAHTPGAVASFQRWQSDLESRMEYLRRTAFMDSRVR